MSAKLDLAFARALTAAKVTADEEEKLARMPAFEQGVAKLAKQCLGREDPPEKPPSDPDADLR